MKRISKASPWRTAARPSPCGRGTATPSAHRVAKAEEAPPAEQETEENRIRKALAAHTVTGLSHHPGGVTVLFGGMILEKGGAVPPVLPDQTEQLYVSEVTPERLTFTWVDRGEGSETRSMVVPIRVRAEVPRSVPLPTPPSR